MMSVTSEKIDEFKKASGYYVYGWVNVDWGNVYFYIGKGSGYRALDITNRSRCFKAITNRWNCYPVLLQDGLSEKEAYSLEFELKQKYMLEEAHPIIDDEGEAGLKKITRRQVVRHTKEPGITLKQFEKAERKCRTMKEVMKELNITRGEYWKWQAISSGRELKL